MRQSSWLRGKITFCIILVISIGVFLRFSNLDRKVYWGDEVYSSLRVFGHTTAQMHQQITIGQPVTLDVLQKFQGSAPNHGVSETLQVLVKEDSHLTPLYFILARIWADWFGSSVAAMRSLSVVFGVLMLPALYWLAMELFASVSVAWVTVLLAAISPVQLIFSQEARFYSLWMLTTVLSSAALLRAMRVKTWASWGQFALALIANLYSQFLAVLTLGGYAIYVLIATWKRDWQNLRRFTVAAGLSFLSLCPWLLIYLNRVPDATDVSTEKSRSLVKAAKSLFVGFSRGFIDFNWDGDASKLQLGILGILTLICLSIVAASMRHLIQQTKLRSYLFVLLLLLSTLLPLLPMSLKDALPSRYLLPCYLALQLSLAYLLGNSLQNSQACRPRWLWSSATVFLVAVGLLSCTSIARADSWWVKQYSSCNVQVAEVVNQSPKPLIISDGDGVRTFDHALSNIISVARLVKPETQFQVFLENKLPDTIEIAQGYSDRFLFSPSKPLLEKLQAQYPAEQLKPVVSGSDNGYRNGQNYCLWRVPS
jgi:uncharacterized membrane protein